MPNSHLQSPLRKEGEDLEACAIAGTFGHQNLQKQVPGEGISPVREHQWNRQIHCLSGFQKRWSDPDLRAGHRHPKREILDGADAKNLAHRAVPIERGNVQCLVLPGKHREGGSGVKMDVQNHTANFWRRRIVLHKNRELAALPTQLRGRVECHHSIGLNGNLRRPIVRRSSFIMQGLSEIPTCGSHPITQIDRLERTRDNGDGFDKERPDSHCSTSPINRNRRIRRHHSADALRGDA